MPSGPTSLPVIHHSRLCSSELPACSIFASEIFVGFSHIADFRARSVEQQPSTTEAQRNRAQVERIRNGAGQKEISIGGLAALERCEPCAIISALAVLLRSWLRQAFGRSVFP